MDNKYIPKKGDWIMWVSNGKPIIAEVLMSRKQDHYPWKIEWVTTEGITSNFVEVRLPVEKTNMIPMGTSVVLSSTTGTNYLPHLEMDKNKLGELEDRNHRDAMEAAFGWHGQG